LDLVNSKIADLQSQFEKRTRELVVRNEHTRLDCKNLKLQLSALKEKAKNMENPEYLLSRVLYLERNPYLIWKMIADQKGNFFFDEVFEKQRTSFGINYKEINKLLMKSRAYDRDFGLFKAGIED
jgi:hypothetical protein